MLTQMELMNALIDVGLATGDTVLVHSSLRALGPVEGRAQGVIDALLTTLGPQGTLALPTHTWSTVHGNQPVFHQTLSPSSVGTLTNVFRMLPGVQRSLHPTHSVAACGARATELVAEHLQETPCALDSPYGKLITWDGAVLMIGVGLDRCTFLHCCEELAECPWMFAPTPEVFYSFTADNQVIPVPSRRHCTQSSNCFPRLEEDFLRIGALRITSLWSCELRLLRAKPTAEWLVPRLRENPHLFYP